MKPAEVIELFEQTGALLDGHFIYASGRHGRRFLQASRVLQFPQHTERLCRALAQRFLADKPTLVVGPATGGIILAYETARHLNCRAAFTEKEPDGSMALKRGFRIGKNERILVVEDIITTGGSVKKTIDHLRARGATVIGVGGIIDRSGGTASFDVRFESLATLNFESYPADSVPEDLAGIPTMEPDDLVL
jgi:orotate phosphoribosyltransferase